MLILRRAVKYLVISILTLFLIIACSNTNNDLVNNQEATAPDKQLASGCRLIQHHLGETEVCGQPQKVVALGVHTLDLLLSLDKQPAGYADILNPYQGEVFDNPTQQIAYLGDRITTKPVNLGNNDRPSLERLTSLKPDLIIGEALVNESSYDLLSKIAPTLLFDNRAAEGQWQKSIQAIAKALEEEQLAQKVIDSYEELIVNARTDLSPVIANNPKLLLLGTNRLPEGIWAINQNTYLGALMEKIGFQMIMSNSGDNYQPNSPVSLEALPQFDNADIIMVLGFELDTSNQQQLLENGELDRQVEAQQLKTAKQSWQENAIAQTLKASQEDRVYFATFYLWNVVNGPISTELILEQMRQMLLNPK
ncbi:ABC-type Fe3+-hydroxamate transport system, periplasmic component [Hyella patelloides LEGE 07179]|uniref:ABC-type Fe3+-hydroxamate transport system, periplasmic component n=1 Tax=Hyella patelloides LEGE 07179 TaxID=945734 RepID=A0A563VYG6_9CYAN|nr:iron-siderophore ABC transporter substrate-binding protein [Hyella patelloides]VEP16471.1 ABC-type Fe3+-hydroxamate transport system, periplasmic component [Hyella patelloides LEGE 07179]